MAGKSGSLQTQTLLVKGLRTSGKCQPLQAHVQPVTPWARVAAVPGINSLSHDAAACLLVDGRVVAVAEGESFQP